MKVSVITISSNSANTISRTIQSVNQQTYLDVEHIFVDNVSTDETPDLIRSQSQRNPQLISEKDRGISDAFNKGIRAATGDVIAILNSDDEFFNEHTLQRVADAFLKEPELSFVFGSMLFIDEDHGTNERQPLLGPITHAMPYNHPAFFVAKSFYETLGLYREDYRYAMDFELISRMYISPTETKLKGMRLPSPPLTTMHAGGASHKYEVNALDDLERALKERGFWNEEAAREKSKRLLRVQMKHQLTRWHLNSLIKLWRSLKWRS